MATFPTVRHSPRRGDSYPYFTRSSAGRVPCRTSNDLSGPSLRLNEKLERLRGSCDRPSETRARTPTAAPPTDGRGLDLGLSSARSQKRTRPGGTAPSPGPTVIQVPRRVVGAAFSRWSASSEHGASAIANYHG
jgi:hypothetical protein